MFHLQASQFLLNLSQARPQFFNLIPCLNGSDQQPDQQGEDDENKERHHPTVVLPGRFILPINTHLIMACMAVKIAANAPPG